VGAVTQDEGTQIPKPSPDPAKTDYVFLGWFSAETGGAEYTWPHTLTASVTMHAQWQDNSQPPAQYTITFNTYGGSAVTAIAQNAGTPVPKPDPDPTKDGYVFLGWYSAESGGSMYAWPHTLTASVTMHAQWWDDNDGPPPTQYTVTFDTHGGSQITAVTQNEGTQVSKPDPDPAKDGYVFLGWFSEETGGTGYDWPHTLSANVTMHAQWQDSRPAAPTIMAAALSSSSISVSWEPVSGASGYRVYRADSSDGTNLIRQATGSPSSLKLSAAGYAKVVWYVDGNTSTPISGDTLTINAADYTTKLHSVAFTGYKNGTPYAQVIPFSVLY
jgi:uncharacterized repeat protein (TIGR02543 family)